MIELLHISKKYQRKDAEIYALKDVTLTIYPRDFVVIMGDSGSGKSTLLQILGCLQKADEGEYRIDKRELTKMSHRQLARFRNETIGFVFQEFHLIPYLNAYENIRLPLLYRGISQKEQQQRVNRLLRLFHLEQRKDHLPHQLSGGQRQRIAIARALVHQPKVILCDEPTGSLDTVHANQMIQILKLMNHYGSTIVMVTHDIRYQTIGNRLFIVKNGEVKECKC